MLERTNVIIQAPVFSASGYGSHSRDLVMGLFNSGKYNISIIPVGWGASSQIRMKKDLDDALIFMCNNRVGEGAPFVWIQVGIPSEFRKVSHINIGITAGSEGEPYPANWAAQCNQMTAIIVPSSFVRDRMVSCGVRVPIHVIPEGVDTTVFNNNPEITPTIVTEELDNLPTSFNFLVTGQWLGGAVGEDRKNIPLSALAVIDSLLDEREVGVIVKTHILNNSSPDRYSTIERLNDLLGERSRGRVHLIHGTLTESELVSVYKHKNTKALLSLTHGEGFGRHLTEAAACDLPILVTGWGGQMDFIRPEFTTVLEYGISQVPPSATVPETLTPNQNWASPDFDKVKNKIRRCYESYSIAKTRAEEYGRVIRSEWSLDKTDKFFVEIVDHTVNDQNITGAKLSGQIII